MGLSTKLRERRKELGLTLAEVAKRVGVSEATAQRWESGNIKNLRHERIVKLAEVLGLSPAELMGWEDKKTPSDEDEKVISYIKNEASPEALLILEKYMMLPKSQRPAALAAITSILDALLSSAETRDKES